MGNHTVSPSSDGVRPPMKAMYTGRGVATRPIPLIVDESEKRAINAAAADSAPKTSAVNMPRLYAAIRCMMVVALWIMELKGSNLWIHQKI